jgi:methylated-DNA-protein-cysteine methyltransferase-like protein
MTMTESKTEKNRSRIGVRDDGGYKKREGLFEEVYEIVRSIPKGKVMTYGQIAKRLGTRDPRKVGWALHGNTDPNTPCHRVVSREGGMARNFAGPIGGGAEIQMKLLRKEGVEFVGDKVELEKFRWKG